MRIAIFVLILAVIAVIAAIASGFLNVNQTRGAQVPDISAHQNGVSASGGQAPAFDVETGSVKVETRDTTVKLPTIAVEPANSADPAPATANSSM
jgi:hypothetical protein